jgi:hypothetical protein
MEGIYFTNAGSKRMLEMLQGYTKVMEGGDAFGDRFENKKEEDSEDSDGEGAKDDEVESLSEDVAGVSMHDDEGATETPVVEDDVDGGCVAGPAASNLEDSMNVVRDTEDEEEDMTNADITKGMPGFRWLKDTEIWARLE